MCVCVFFNIFYRAALKLSTARNNIHNNFDEFYYYKHIMPTEFVSLPLFLSSLSLSHTHFAMFVLRLIADIDFGCSVCAQSMRGRFLHAQCPRSQSTAAIFTFVCTSLFGIIPNATRQKNARRKHFSPFIQTLKFREIPNRTPSTNPPVRMMNMPKPKQQQNRRVRLPKTRTRADPVHIVRRIPTGVGPHDQGVRRLSGGRR